ncbi:MAG: hypothetical protein IJP10_00765 [Clostridia bacterium]|nr:hypothetical protein [Clostridia bacterium]
MAQCRENGISFVRGDSYTAKLYLHSIDSDEPYILKEGDTGLLMVFDTSGKAVIRKEFSCDDQSEDASVAIVFLPSDTEGITDNCLCYEVEIRTSEGDVFTLLYGEFSLILDMITSDIREVEGGDC